MNDHENFCKKLGNEFYTRHDYTDEDREVREALKQGIEDYKNTAHERASQSKEMRATAFAQQSSDLKKLEKHTKKLCKIEEIAGQDKFFRK